MRLAALSTDGPMPKYLFIGGLQRSGTTALCEMLNGHPALAIGMERYRFLWRSGKLMERNVKLFRKTRFFSWRPKDSRRNPADVTNAYHPFYERMKARYDDALYVGDKVPNYYKVVDELIEAFPEPRILLIWRGLGDVAMSWDRRSRDGSWSAENDAEEALRRGGDAMRTLIAAKERHPDLVRLVSYDRIFASEDASPFGILDWLGVPQAPEYEAAVAETRATSRRLSQEREEVRDDVRRTAGEGEVGALAARLEALSD